MDRESTLCETIVIKRADALLVGDRVNLFADQPGAAYGWGTVVAVTEDFAEVVRPYVHTADFAMCTGQGQVDQRIISYLGQEVTKLPRNSVRTYSVVFRYQVPR